MQFDYFYPEESENYVFYRTPKVLCTDKRFRGLSSDAKLLYGILLDRIQLSKKNRWIDEEGHVYVYMTIESIEQALGRCHQKSCKVLKELVNFGLVEQKKQGLGKPTKLYVHNFGRVWDANLQKYETHTHGSMQDIPAEVCDSYSNNSPIKARTIETDACSLYRMVRWITENCEEVRLWTDFSEAIVNHYLLSLPASNRECTRKDLYQFFKFAKRKRCIFTIPMTDYKTRAIPRVCEALTNNEQRLLYRAIKMEGISSPYEALLTSLCFFHAMQPMRIAEIKIASIDIERRVIRMQNIPDIFLMSMEMVLLKEYLFLREGFPNHDTNSHLFIRRNRGDYLPDQAVTKTFITKSVQSFCGFGPQTLRITCLQEMAALNGPNFLREAYGISATHAGRYGSYEEYLVEEALKEINFS